MLRMQIAKLLAVLEALDYQDIGNEHANALVNSAME